ncbi:MAG: aminotransferase class III-fold pyridoxal phosphate-dependent enzyme [Pseudomonadota bacterium]
MDTHHNAPLAFVLDEARARYAQARPRARDVHEAACHHLPGGNTRTVLYHGPFPLRAERGEGAYLFDTDGHRYLNLLGEYTAGLFGHSHPAIMAALTRAQAIGMNLGAHNLAEAELARLVTQRFRVMERVRFTNSGTEANLMAVATCRHVTGRDKVMVFDGGYHGGLLYFGGGGIPINAPYAYVVAPYNDTEGTRALIEAHRDDLACILVEPMLGSTGCIPAQPGFLAALREGASAIGAKLIFDEVMTSRFAAHGSAVDVGSAVGAGDDTPSEALGGGALAGVAPDMMTLGKWVGGGMSFGAYGGAADVMAIYDPSREGAMPHAGTFNNNIFSMTAGAVALRDIFTPHVAADLHARGERLRAAINAIFADRGIAMCASGVGSLINVHAVAGPVTTPRDLANSIDEAKELLFLDLLERGYYIARRGFIALSMVITDDEIDGFLEALSQVVDARRAALPHGRR